MMGAWPTDMPCIYIYIYTHIRIYIYISYTYIHTHILHMGFHICLFCLSPVCVGHLPTLRFIEIA